MFTRNRRQALNYGVDQFGKLVGGLTGFKLANKAANTIANTVTRPLAALPGKPSRSGKRKRYSITYQRIPKRVKRSSYRKGKRGAAKGALRKKIKGVVNSTLAKLKNVSTFRKNALLDQKLDFNDKDIDYYIVGARFGNANNTPFTLKACKFTPLSVERIADAASVLFNGKTASYDATVETGNFTPVKTKINVVYASYSMTMRNVTNMPFYLEVLEVTNKDNQAEDEFFAEAEDLLSDNNISAGPNPVHITTTSPSDNIYATTKNLKFTDLQELKGKYSIRKIASKYIPIGGIWKHTWSMKNKQIDLRKFNQSDTLLYDYCQGDKQIILKCTPRLHYVYKAGEHGCATLATYNDVSVGLAFEIDEVFKIAQPENTSDANEGVKTVIWNENRITPSIGGDPLIRDVQPNGIATSTGVYTVVT